MTEQKKRATRKRKAKAKPAEVPVEESKSAVEVEQVLPVSEPELDGGNDSKPEKDSGDGSDNVQAEAAPPKRQQRVTTTLWTS